MIKTKLDLIAYLHQDSAKYVNVNSFLKRVKHYFVSNPIDYVGLSYKYIRCLRFAEYHHNNSMYVGQKSFSALIHTLWTFFYFSKLKELSYKSGIQIPPNTVGPGLTIFHYGTIVINPYAKIGSGVVLNPGVTIGNKHGRYDTPVIGDNVTIGTGAKIIGPIKVGNNVVIAPNAVVVKDVPNNAIVAGIPAKVIKYKADNDTL